MILIQTFIALIVGLSVEIRKGRCNDTPYDICCSNGKVGVLATSKNLEYLTNMLKNNGIPNAYVFGWNDQVLPMVLYPNGALAPYDKYTNSSEYAFCMVECPCPRDNVVCNSTSPAKNRWDTGCNIPQANTCEMCPIPQKPCDKPKPKPVNPCKDKCNSSSSDSSQEENNCPIFVKQFKKCTKESKKCNNDKPFIAREVVSSLKNYSFKQAEKKTYILKSQEEVNILKEEKYVVSERNNNCDKYKIPKILCSPSMLKKVMKYLECKCQSPVCLYVNDCNEIFALIGDDLYAVKISKKHHKEKISVKKLGKHTVKKLIKKGLYGVGFNKDC